MIVNNVSDDTSIFMIFPCKKDLAPVNNRMTVGKAIYMSVQYDSLSDKVRVLQVITSFNVITYVIANDYLIRITGKVYVGKHIHNNS